MLKKYILKSFNLYASKLAVKDEKNQLTYKELKDLIVVNMISLQDSKLAGILTGHNVYGLGAELLCLYSDTVFVPIVDNLPLKRICQMIKISKIDTLIVTSENTDLINELKLIFPKMKIVFLKGNARENDRDNFLDEQIDISNESCDTMYHLYTSGTTGIPKAVIQGKKAVYHFAKEYINNLSISGKDNLTLFSSLAHDASIVDIYSSLLAGASLFMVDVTNPIRIKSLNRWLINNSITVWHSVPTLFRSYFRLSQEVAGTQLRLMVFGGEVLLESDFSRAQERFPVLKVYSLYGQTEHSYSSGLFINNTGDIGKIGTPINKVNLKFEFLKANNYSLILESPYIFKGYLTEDGLIKNFTDYFETGDLVDAPNKASYYLGRKDREVKIRGYRVNLTEIESLVLKQFLQIDIWLLPLKIHDTHKLIAVYKGSKLDLYEINELISENLPSYNLISKLLFLEEEFPRTITGKRDLVALERLLFQRYL